MITKIRRIDGSTILFICILSGCYINIFRSLDFGYHWDEGIQYKLLVQTAENFIPLPLNFYNYPSFMYDISLIVGLILLAIAKTTGIDTLHSNYWFVPMRTIFSTLCFMGIFFLFLAIKRSFGKLPAFFTGFVMMFSFQIQYHSRWIASDMLLASLACIWIYVYLSPKKSQGIFSLYLPAIVAGVGTSIKYQGAVLLLPTLISLILSKESKKYTLILKNILTFLVAFLMITPGALIQAPVFVRNVLEENKHYRTTHGEYLGVQINLVNSPIEFLGHSIRYLFFIVPSSLSAIGILLSTLFIFGLWQIFRKKQWSNVIFLVFPLLITLLYYSTLSVWIARNLLFLFPFVITISAAGMSYLVKVRLFRKFVTVICLVIAPAGLFTTFKDAQTIVQRGDIQLVNLLKQTVEGDSSTCYFASGKVLSLLSDQRIFHEKENYREEERVWVILDTELRSHAQDIQLERWPAFGDKFFRTIGSKEVDFNSYPYWFGDPRFILLNKEQLFYLGFTSKDLAKFRLSTGCLRFGK
jgi:Dolichyl-phosphate-mannose-protein mannosyltransferase